MTKPDKSNHFFVLVLGGPSEPTAELEDALFEAGCDDALLTFRGTTGFLEFDREGSSFDEAVISAISQVEGIGDDVVVLRVEPDDVVNAAEIARRAGMSREAVRLWSSGERGNVGFPSPIAVLGPRTLLWSWAEVAGWLSQRGELEKGELRRARVLGAINARLNRRREDTLLDVLPKSMLKRLTRTNVIARSQAQRTAGKPKTV